MKAAATLFAAVLAGATILHAQESFTVSKSLPTHGALTMEVNFGEVRIVRSDEARTISITIDPHGEPYDDTDMQSWIQRFDVSGERAAIDLKLPHQFRRGNSSSPKVTVSLPAYTDLKLEMGVGQLTVKGIEGNKDLHVDIGQVTVGVADGTEYNEIHTGSKIGQANNDISHERSGGFFPSTKHVSAKGLYRLDATVDIGQVDVVQE